MTKTRSIYQYNYGQVLVLTGVDLPATYEVHFSNSEFGVSKVQVGNSDGVTIPDEYLESGADIYAWLYLHTGADDGETVYKILIPVEKRASISPEEPTPVQQDAITQAIAALNDAVGQTAQDVENAEAAAETAHSAAASAHNNALAAGQSAEAAAESASQAAASARTATAKASEAAQSATAAETAKNAAAASATTAQTAATTASGKADEASRSADTAAAKATEAASSAQSAQSAANSAAAAQSAAETAQSAAETSADEAESSADDAQDAKEAAETLMTFPATGGAAASVATVTDAANDQPMALKINILPAQAGSGTPSPENVRPISGWTGAVIRRSGSDTSNPTVFSVAFPTAAGTVYGGTLDIAKDGTGTLTVTRAYYKGFTQYAQNSTHVSWQRGGCANPLTSNVGGNGYMCNMTDNFGSFSSATVNQVIMQPNTKTANVCYIALPLGVDGAGVEISYLLETPTVYTFTAEQIKSLFGTNNVWADCGNTQITAYTADKTLLIQQAEQRVENLTVSSETLPAGSSASVEKQENADGINLHFGIPKGADGQSGGVTDVRVNGTSILSGGVANIPEASATAYGVVKTGTVSVTGTTPTITALSGIQYVCGEVSTLDITLPASGIVDVVFESGSTPTVLTVTPSTGMTVEWANGFDSTALEADTLYELNIKMVGTKCLGVAAAWT